MSGPATTTTVSAQRSPIAQRREERKRFDFFSGGALTHLVILGLAALIWWIALGMVSESRPLEDAAALTITLDADLQQDWVLLPPSQSRVSMTARGPVKELARFAGEVSSNRNLLSYNLNITRADIERLDPDNRRRILLRVPLNRFAAQLKVPPEISVVPTNPTQMILIPLEQIVTRDAAVIFQGRIVGSIQGYSYSVSVSGDSELEVRAPAARMREISNEEGRPELRIVRLEIDRLVANRIIAERKEREQLLKDGFTQFWDIAPVEGVKIRRKGTDTETLQVALRFTFEALTAFADVEREFVTSVIYPAWMVEKGVRALNVPRSRLVQMEVLSTQTSDFNDANVRLRLDLSNITPDDVKMDPDPAAGVKRGRIFNLYLSLDINAAKLTFRFKNPLRVTAAQFDKVEEVQLEWTEP